MKISEKQSKISDNLWKALSESIKIKYSQGQSMEGFNPNLSKNKKIESVC